MSITAITSANLANAIVKLVAADALPALMGNLVMGNLVNRDYEPTLAQAGDTVNVPIPPTLAANNIAEGGLVTPQIQNLGNAQIVLNTHAEATFQIPDVTKVLAVPDLLKLYMQPAVVALAEKIESDLLGLYPSFHGEYGGGNGRDADHGSDGGFGGDGAVHGQGSGERSEVPGGGFGHVFDAAADSAVQRIQHGGRSRAASAGGRRGRQDEGLLHFPLAIRGQDGQRSGDDAQPGVREGCDRPGGAASAATSAGNRRDRGVRGAGKLRHAGDDELSAEHAGAAVHGGRAVRRRRAAEQFRGTGA